MFVFKGKNFLLWAGLLALLATVQWAQPRDESSGRRAELVSINAEQLPPEARDTLRLIELGGPFPYDRDGIVFGNFERRLPVKERGYYQEYTVKTPGVKSRGARRIVAGGCAGGVKSREDRQRKLTPCVGGERYYTADHYKTFKRVVP